MDPWVQVNEQITIPSSELEFITSRSSGPGGQNVNKVESRVTLHFDVMGSVVLSESQKEAVRSALSTRISKAGILRVVSQKHRTQGANRKTAIERFALLLADAVKTRAKRKPTRKPKRADLRRLEAKRQRGRFKRDKRLSIDSSVDW